MFTNDLLAGKAGVITGGSSGIGLAMAKYLVDHGAQVTITGRDEEKLQQAVKELGENARGVAGDVRDESSVKENLQQHLDAFGQVDFLLNNAAGNFLCPLEKMSSNAFKAVNDIVALGTFHWSQAVFPHMQEAGGGKIINTGAIYAWSQAAGVAHSGAAKAAVMSLTRTMATEWGRFGIRSNMIAPGAVENTEGVRRLMADPRTAQAMLEIAPIPRLAHGWEVGALAAFLLSDLGSYINGAVIPLDGGFHLVNPGLLPQKSFLKVVDLL